VTAAISELLGKRGDYARRLREKREDTVFAFGRSSAVGAQTILALLGDPAKELNAADTRDAASNDRGG
jgi:hypothetical protein